MNILARVFLVKLVFARLCYSFCGVFASNVKDTWEKRNANDILTYFFVYLSSMKTHEKLTFVEGNYLWDLQVYNKILKKIVYFPYKNNADLIYCSVNSKKSINCQSSPASKGIDYLLLLKAIAWRYAKSFLEIDLRMHQGTINSIELSNFVAGRFSSVRPL